MQNEKLIRNCGQEKVAELFSLHINPLEIRQFMERAKEVHHFFSTLEGYEGIDILFLSEPHILVLVRWNNDKLFEKHLPQILNACPISNWLKSAVSVSHQPSILQSFRN